MQNPRLITSAIMLCVFMAPICCAATLGAAFADELTTSGDAKSLGFSAARLARIAPWYQARFDSFSPSDGLVPGAVVAIAASSPICKPSDFRTAPRLYR
jgi:hypothetical protein